jgi:cyclopropane-fatty-acyl-phospholipid synthase
MSHSVPSVALPFASLIGRQRCQDIVEAFLERADVRINGSRPWDIRLHRDRFYRRVLAHADVGFGESYMDGDWSCDRIDEMGARVFAAGLQHAVGGPVEMLDNLLARIPARHSRRRVRREVAPHYDLGNELFEAILDTRHMAYTCAYWRGGAETLEDAQEAKLDLICRKLTLQPGMRVLDIGCGWGGLARYAASRYGVSVLGVTVSKEQVSLGSARAQGLPVELRVEDYRDVVGRFDRVVSIGCLEHVGHRHHRRFFQIVRERLADAGYALVHTIGFGWRRYRVGRFMDRYVFPLVNPPSFGQIGSAIDGLFVLEDVQNIGTDYDRTAMEWHARFQREWPRLEGRYAALLDGRFKRMFEFYLQMSAAFFRTRQAQVWQIVLSPPGRPQPACRCW